jgi:hypothetical protein
VVRGRHCVPVLAGDKTILSRRGRLKEPETEPIQHLLGGVVAWRANTGKSVGCGLLDPIATSVGGAWSLVKAPRSA